MKEQTEECHNQIIVTVVGRLHRRNTHLQSLLLFFQPLPQLGKHIIVSSWAFALLKVSDHVYVLLMNTQKTKLLKKYILWQILQWEKNINTHNNLSVYV